jgi:hypothetical protein
MCDKDAGRYTNFRTAAAAGKGQYGVNERRTILHTRPVRGWKPHDNLLWRNHVQGLSMRLGFVQPTLLLFGSPTESR